MTPAERGALEGFLASPPESYGLRRRCVDVSIGAMAGLLAGSIPAVVALSRGSARTAGWLWVACGVIGLAIGGFVNWRATGSMRDRRALYEWEIAEGAVTEFECSVSTAAEIYEPDGVGTTYLLQVEPNRVLYLDGKYLAPAAHQFPSPQFRLARAPHSWEVLTFESEGPRLPDVPMVESSSLKRRDLHDGELLDGVIDDFIRR